MKDSKEAIVNASQSCRAFDFLVAKYSYANPIRRLINTSPKNGATRELSEATPDKAMLLPDQIVRNENTGAASQFFPLIIRIYLNLFT